MESILKNLKYDITETPRTIHELLLYGLQQALAVFVATVLIANICGTPISSCLFGAGVATLFYQDITKFRSPMFISSCGATSGAVIAALALGGYSAVVVGGAIIAITYTLFAIFIKLRGIEHFNRLFPPTIVGAVTIVIGLNLAKYIATYVLVDNVHSDIGMAVAIFTMLVVAAASHYFKGFLKTIPFLIGIILGYLVALVLTLTGVAQLVDLSLFQINSIFMMPDFTFKYLGPINLSQVIEVIILFLPVAIVALLEHYSDHKVLSGVVGTDLTVEPGLHRTLIGDGFASWLGTILCGLPNTSYGESIATVGISRVASVKVLSTAAVILIILSFLTPVQALISSIPSCVFGGCAMILYGYIALSGLRTILNAKVDFDNNKNLIVVAVILTTGISGTFFLSSSFGGTSLAMVLGLILNIVLKNPSKSKTL